MLVYNIMESTYFNYSHKLDHLKKYLHQFMFVGHSPCKHFISDGSDNSSNCMYFIVKGESNGLIAVTLRDIGALHIFTTNVWNSVFSVSNIKLKKKCLQNASKTTYRCLTHKWWEVTFDSTLPQEQFIDHRVRRLDASSRKPTI